MIRRKSLRVLYVMLGISLVMASCKKKHYPEPETDPVNQPVFYFQGDVNGAAVNLQAGINDYYMHSDYTIDGNNVCNFKGTLDQLTPVSSQEKIEIIINDSRTLNSYNVSNADSSLSINNYLYKVGAPATFYQVRCIPYNMSGSSFQWDFGDGIPVPVTTESSIRHSYRTANVYNIQLTGNSGSATSTVVRQIKPTGVGSCFTSIVSAVSNTMTPTQVVFTAQQFSALGTPTHTWDFGDGYTGNGLSASHLYNPGIYQVTFTSVDGAGDTSVDHCNIAVGMQGYTANFSWELNQSMISNPFAFQNVIIRWTDANGTVYTSDNAGQLSNAYFNVLSVEDYKVNENNAPTKKMKVRFKCQLFNGSSSILIDNAEAVIAVAYKN